MKFQRAKKGGILEIKVVVTIGQNLRQDWGPELKVPRTE
jgi:hypothetical protein